MSARYTNYTQQLMEAILESSGETASTLRCAVQEQAAQWSSHATPSLGQLPQEVHAYVKKVALHAYKTTTEDIETLRNAGYSEDAIFELTLSAALGAGMSRLERGLLALQGGRDATQEH